MAPPVASLRRILRYASRTRVAQHGLRSAHWSTSAMSLRGTEPMHAINPPFRADHVGSLLRPPKLKEARRRAQLGVIPPEELRAAEDEAIREVVRRQEAVGLQSITDGEFRREFFHLDFLQRLQGVTTSAGVGAKFHTRD